MSKKEIRSIFRTIVFDRDKGKCRMCGHKAVDAHHITNRKEIANGGYVLSNGISLCSVCHWSAEEYHRTSGKSGLTPNYLYALICSSLEKAVQDSEKLNVR